MLGGVTYFAFILDVFSRRKIVGWQLAAHMRRTLVLDALKMALGTRRGPHAVELVHHSDRGSQGGFKWSSQRLTERSCDGQEKGGVRIMRVDRVCVGRGDRRRGARNIARPDERTTACAGRDVAMTVVVRATRRRSGAVSESNERAKPESDSRADENRDAGEDLVPSISTQRLAVARLLILFVLLNLDMPLRCLDHLVQHLPQLRGLFARLDQLVRPRLPLRPVEPALEIASFVQQTGVPLSLRIKHRRRWRAKLAAVLQALYRRKKPQLGHARAIGALKDSVICACWRMLSTGEIYNDLRGDYYSRRDPERQIRRLVTQLERLGQNVTLQKAA
jgi:hypothetical protein